MTKIHVLTDVLGRPGVLLLTPGNASDVTTAPAVLAEAPGRIRRLAAARRADGLGPRPPFPPCAERCART